MTCLEHLIENCLVRIEDGKDYKDIMGDIRKDINLQHAGITPEQCYEICQYVYYTFISGRYEKVKGNYNEQKDDLANDISEAMCSNVDVCLDGEVLLDGYYDCDYDGMAEELLNQGWHK